MAMAIMRISKRDRVQHRNLQKQLLFLFGGLECVTGKARSGRGGGWWLLLGAGSGLSDLVFVGINGAVGACCGASTSVTTG